MTIQSASSRLAFLCSMIPSKIKNINEDDLCKIPAPGKWSKKQILGHLIDSASNNHQRFIRIQFENEPVIFYNQDDWNLASNYNKLDSYHLIEFWRYYNEHLSELIIHITPDKLNRKGALRDGRKETLSWYIIDYVDHLEHHLRQIVDY